MLATIHVNLRVRLPKEVKANKETCKVWKTRVHCTSYMPGNTRRNTNIYGSENGSNKCISQQKIFTVRRLVQWWWTTRWNIIWIGQRGIVLCGQTIFRYYYLWWQKNGKTWSEHARLRTRVAMDEGLLSVWVSQSIGQSRSVDENCYLLNSGFASTMS